jgi:hypothetical protein
MMPETRAGNAAKAQLALYKADAKAYRATHAASGHHDHDY